MNVVKQTPRTLLTMLVAAATLWMVAGAAATPVTHRYDLQTPKNGDGVVGGADGSARAHGVLTWYGPRNVHVAGRIDDRCPKDGYSAVLWVRFTYTNGTKESWMAKYDGRGCEYTVGVPFLAKFTRLTPRIRSLSLCLLEHDVELARDADQVCTKRLDNPFT